MSSFEDDDDSSRHTTYSLADESFTPPEDEVEAPVPRQRQGRGGGRRGGRRGGQSPDMPPSLEPIEDLTSHPYSEAETCCLGRCWVDIGSDAITGTNQRIAAVWIRIAKRYNEIRPVGTVARSSEKLRNHWKRAMAEIKQFEACYTSTKKNVGSGESQETIVRNAYADYRATYGKVFKHFETWETVRETPKFMAATGSSDAVKRCKVGGEGYYSTSGSDPEESTAAAPSEPEFRPRPEGSKAAKARAKGKSKLSVPDEPVAARRVRSLGEIAEGIHFPNLYEVYMKDTSGMTPEQLHKHNIMCDYIEGKLGLRPRRLPPPED